MFQSHFFTTDAIFFVSPRWWCNPLVAVNRNCSSIGYKYINSLFLNISINAGKLVVCRMILLSHEMLRLISTVAMFSLVYQPVESTSRSHSNTGAVEGVTLNSYERKRRNIPPRRLRPRPPPSLPHSPPSLPPPKPKKHHYQKTSSKSKYRFLTSPKDCN